MYIQPSSTTNKYYLLILLIIVVKGKGIYRKRKGLNGTTKNSILKEENNFKHEIPDSRR